MSACWTKRKDPYDACRYYSSLMKAAQPCAFNIPNIQNLGSWIQCKIPILQTCSERPLQTSGPHCKLSFRPYIACHEWSLSLVGMLSLVSVTGAYMTGVNITLSSPTQQTPTSTDEPEERKTIGQWLVWRVSIHYDNLSCGSSHIKF